jgi:hypothetical protein
MQPVLKAGNLVTSVCRLSRTSEIPNLLDPQGACTGLSFVYRVIKRSLCTCLSQHTSFLPHYLHQSDCFKTDRQGQGDTIVTQTPSVISNSNYVIVVRDWNCLKYFSYFCIVIIMCTETFLSPCITGALFPSVMITFLICNSVFVIWPTNARVYNVFVTYCLSQTCLNRRGDNLHTMQIELCF